MAIFVFAMNKFVDFSFTSFWTIRNYIYTPHLIIFIRYETCVQITLLRYHPSESVRPNGPKIRQKCIFDKNLWGVQPDFCKKSHK